MVFREDVPLAPLTTLGVGGPARYYAEAETEGEVAEAVEFARSRQLPLFVLGGGSNVVIADAGFAGLVLKLGIADVSIVGESEDGIVFDAGAGANWDALVSQSVEAGFTGLECLSGIPGTVGGTPVQNVGAYGQEVSQTIREVRVLDLLSSRIRTLLSDECGFKYRISIFNTTERGRYIVLRVSFALSCGEPSHLSYPDLKTYFAGMSHPPTIAEVRSAILEIRQRKAMLIVPGDEEAQSVGSFFRNPIVPQAFFEELRERLSFSGKQLPSYEAGNGFRKLPAAWLVEQAGFAKGYTKGAAGISRKHALAIINRGGASAADIISLRNAIQSRVADQFGVQLLPEPVFIGFDPSAESTARP